MWIIFISTFHSYSVAGNNFRFYYTPSWCWFILKRIPIIHHHVPSLINRRVYYALRHNDPCKHGSFTGASTDDGFCVHINKPRACHYRILIKDNLIYRSRITRNVSLTKPHLNTYMVLLRPRKLAPRISLQSQMKVF